MVRLTPLEPWIKKKIGVGSKRLQRSDLEAYQLDQLNRTIALARERSRFYTHRLAGVSIELERLADLAKLPFTTPEELRGEDLQFLCVSQGDIQRIVTLDTSGSTGNPKRIYFTSQDQELTIDFFQNGMSTFTEPEDQVMILLPHERPGSVGDLLAIGLDRLGAIPLRYGPIRDPKHALFTMQDRKAKVLVGAPVNVLTLARFWEAEKEAGWAKPEKVLLTTDRVPQAIRHALQAIWGCTVYDHYGMTEMGLGGGVECRARRGYHLREADLYFEIIDPHTGQVLPDGERGEVVFTTLTRQGMPLIRYRTGDLSRIISGRCLCGTVLRTMEKIHSRLGGEIGLRNPVEATADSLFLTIADLDEALFPIPKLLNFSATLDERDGKDRLWLKAVVMPDEAAGVEEHVLQTLKSIPAIRVAEQSGVLSLCVQVQAFHMPTVGSLAKRVILDQRGENHARNLV